MVNVKRNIMKLLCFMIAFSIMMSALCFIAFSSESGSDSSPFYNIICIYDSNTETVKIEYRMKSDDVKKYSGNDIFVYALPVNTYPTYIEETQLEPVSEALTASNRSTVEIPVLKLEERLSAYVLGIDTGRETVYSEIFAPNAGGISVNSSFKGVNSTNVAYVTESAAGTVILEVNTDLLDGGTSGYLYTVGDQTYTFSGSYVSELDGIMKIYGGLGCDVYLRFISEEGPLSLLSSNYSDQRNIYAYTSFLCSRYQTDEYGEIAGIIPSKPCIDGSQYFTKEYAASLYAAAAALEDIGKSCPLILPLSGNIYQIQAFLNDFSNISAKYGLPTVTVMIESDRTPYGMGNDITEAVDSGEIIKGNINKSFNSGYLSPENLSNFESYIKSVSNRTGCIFPEMIYHWLPSSELGKDAASAAYVYNYYKLYFESNVISYIVSFDSFEDNSETPKTLTNTVRYIDSNLSDDHIDTDKILNYFGFSDWEDEIDGFSEKDIVSSTIIKNKLYHKSPISITGSYNYFDFSSASGMSGWFSGSECTGLSSGKTDFGKGLTARFSNNSVGGCFIAYKYKYLESFKYTDLISIDFSIDTVDETTEIGSDYGVYIILGGEDFQFEYVAEGLAPKQKYTVYADVSNLTELNEVKYIQIGSFGEVTDSHEHRMHIYSVNAESSQYSDEELAELIESERERLKSDETEATLNRVAVAFIVACVIITAVVMIMVSRRTQRDAATVNKDQDNLQNKQ